MSSIISKCPIVRCFQNVIHVNLYIESKYITVQGYALVKQSFSRIIQWWWKFGPINNPYVWWSYGNVKSTYNVIQISVVRNPNIRGSIQCPVIAPIVTPVVTKYSSLSRTEPYSLYSCYSESKLSIWFDTHIYTLSIYLESSPSFFICCGMFTPLYNYLDHSSIHGVKTILRLRAIYRR